MEPSLPAFEDTEELEVATALPAAGDTVALPAFEETEEVIAPSETSMTQGEALGRGLTQGATFGLASRTGPAIDGIVESIREKLSGKESSLAPGAGVIEKVRAARLKELSNQKEASDKHFWTTLSGEIVGGLPSMGVAGAAAAATKAGKAFPLLSQVLTQGTLGGVYGYGQSDKEGKEALEDAAATGLFSAGLTGLFGGIPKILKKGAGWVIRGGDKSFEVGAEMQKNLLKRESQIAVRDALVSAPTELKQAIESGKRTLGPRIDEVVAQIPELPVNVSRGTNSTLPKVLAIDTAGDEGGAVAKNKADLINKIKTFTQEVAKRSGTNDLEKVPLATVHELKRAFQDSIFDQEIYKNTPSIDRLAKKWVGSINAAINQADLGLGGTGGELSKTNRAYFSLLRMRPQEFNGGGVLKGLSDTTNSAAKTRYDKAIGSYGLINPEIRKHLLPELENTLMRKFPDLITKAQIMKLVTQRDVGSILTPSGLINTLRGSGDAVMNVLGANQGGLQALERGVQTTFPAIGNAMNDKFALEDLE